MKVTQWLVAAALLFTVGGAAQAQEVTLPDKGTTEWSVAGDVEFSGDSSWNLDFLWAPFTSRTLQWGVALGIVDGENFDTSGTIGALVNYYFRSGNESATLPYVGLGYSTSFGDLEGDVWNIHGGVKHFISTNVAIRGELQWRNYTESGIDDTVGLNLGISVFR